MSQSSNIQTSIVIVLCFSIFSSAFPQIPSDSLKPPSTTHSVEINDLFELNSANKSDTDSVEAFLEAVESGDTETVQQLIAQQNVNAVDADGISTLHWVTENGKLDIAKLLIENGAQINHQDNIHQRTPLHLAVLRGVQDIVRLLIEKGADVNVKDIYGKTAFDVANEIGNRDIIEYLTQMATKDEMTLHDAVSKGDIENVNRLVKLGDINSLENNGKSALHLAAIKGDVTIVKLLIKNAANVNVLDNDSSTPLHRAAEKNKIKVVKLLLKNGADINAKDKHGCTPLMRSAEQGFEDLTKLLIKRGARTTIIDNYQTTAAGWARARGNYQVARIIQEAANFSQESDESDDTDSHIESTSDASKKKPERENLNKKDSEGRTPLHLATLNGNENEVNTLLDSGADVNLVDNVGSTPLHRAAEKNYLKIAEILIEYGVNIDYKDVYGCTALHRAAEHGNENIANLLIKKGAKLDITDNYLDTPLGWAKASGNYKVANLLIEKGARKY